MSANFLWIFMAQIPPPTPTYLPPIVGTPMIQIPQWSLWDFAPTVVGTANQMDAYFMDGARIAFFVLLLLTAMFFLWNRIKSLGAGDDRQNR